MKKNAGKVFTFGKFSNNFSLFYCVDLDLLISKEFRLVHQFRFHFPPDRSDAVFFSYLFVKEIPRKIFPSYFELKQTKMRNRTRLSSQTEFLVKMVTMRICWRFSIFYFPNTCYEIWVFWETGHSGIISVRKYMFVN